MRGNTGAVISEHKKLLSGINLIPLFSSKYYHTIHI